MKTIKLSALLYLTFLVCSCVPTVDFTLAQEQVRIYEEFQKMDRQDSTDEASVEPFAIQIDAIQECKPCTDTYTASCNPKTTYNNLNIERIKEVYCKSLYQKRPIIGGCGSSTCRGLGKVINLIYPIPFEKIQLTDSEGQTTILPFEKKDGAYRIAFPETGNFKMELIKGDESEELNIMIRKLGLFPSKKFNLKK
ncbi:hypothetical protein [Maribacter sp. 2-571]|uniref:hypothetical protein n=1 Tax=Maribacter sp. 2-571 TaxID=3417569 RepID=UPI003D336E1E